MIATDSRVLRAILNRDGDALRFVVPEGAIRQLTVGPEVYTIRRELRDGLDIIIVRNGDRLIFSESVKGK